MITVATLKRTVFRNHYSITGFILKDDMSEQVIHYFYIYFFKVKKKKSSLSCRHLALETPSFTRFLKAFYFISRFL